VAEGSFGPDGKKVMGGWKKVQIVHTTRQILGRYIGYVAQTGKERNTQNVPVRKSGGKV